MRLLMFVLAYLLSGCLVEWWVHRKLKIPNLVMLLVWPLFLVICAILGCMENILDEEYTDDTQ